MDKPLPKNAFDQADRERTRAAVLAYMRENQVGVPTLIKRMAAVLNHREDYIPQKTLQRFLAGVMRTNDAFVRICYDFAQTLPPVRDELAEFADSVSCFFHHPGQPSATGESATELPSMFYIYDQPQDRRSGLLPPSYGELRLDCEGPSPFVRVREKVHGPWWPGRPTDPEGQLKEGLQGLQKRVDYHYEGVLFSFDRFRVAFLRNTLTRLPRIHWFPRAEGEVQCACSYAPFPQDPRTPMTTTTFYLKPFGT